MRCSWLGLVVCAGALAACSGGSEQCGDGQDNDDNGLVDCDDPACPAGSACGPGGLMCGTGTPCTSTSVESGSPPLGSMRVASVQYPVMGSRYSGWQEENAIAFEVLDAAGLPYPPGLAVTFTHASQGGSFVGLTPVCGPGPFPTCTATATTNAQGRAIVVLTAGRRFGVLSVRATASAGGVQVTAVADDIAVVGVKPNGAHLGMDCRPWNVPALTEHDCQTSQYAGPGSTVDCVLSVADRHGIAVGFPTLVAFWSEAGAAGAPVLTCPYKQEPDANETRKVGEAVGYVSVRDQPLPWDVPPFADEYGLLVNFGCEQRFANPRDGLVTVIGLVAGEEGFVDVNSDGLYDPDEPFVDIGEPFIDANDNGVRDPAEPFQDVNEDGVYTEPNGIWDADTILWTQTRIVYTGHPAFRQSGGMEEYSRLYDDGVPPFPTLPAPPFTGSRMYDVYFADENFNPLSALTSYAAGTVFEVASASLPFVPGGAEPLGAHFRLLYCAPDGTSCVYGPAATACTTRPCHVVPEVSGFTYGTYFDLSVKCNFLSGPDTAYVTATLNGVTHWVTVPGTCP